MRKMTYQNPHIFNENPLNFKNFQGLVTFISICQRIITKIVLKKTAVVSYFRSVNNLNGDYSGWCTIAEKITAKKQVLA